VSFHESTISKTLHSFPEWTDAVWLTKGLGCSAKQDFLADSPGDVRGVGTSDTHVFNWKYFMIVSFHLVKQSMKHSQGNVGRNQNRIDTGITCTSRIMTSSLILFRKHFCLPSYIRFWLLEGHKQITCSKQRDQCAQPRRLSKVS
jgi:hypothetical protein